MPVCIVLGCISGKQSLLDTKIPIPKSPSMRNKWLVKINRLDYEGLDKARICIKHFCRDDFTDYKTVRGKENVIRRLKPTAVPSLYLSNHPMNYYSIRSNNLSSANQQETIEDKNKVNSDTELIQVLQNPIVAWYKLNSEVEDEHITTSILPKGRPIPAPRRNKRPWNNMSSDNTILPKPKKRTKFYHQGLQSEPIIDESSAKPDDNKNDAAEPNGHAKKQNESDTFNEPVDEIAPDNDDKQDDQGNLLRGIDIWSVAAYKQLMTLSIILLQYFILLPCKVCITERRTNSGVFLQRQQRIVNYYAKKFVKESQK